MDQYESTRRNFIRKLGLSLGAAVAVTSGIKAGVIEKKETVTLTTEQEKFMVQYEKWMDDFIKVIHIQKENPHHMDNNKQLIKLTEVAKAWQPQLTKYMKDDNFARYFMIVTERMTSEIV